MSAGVNMNSRISTALVISALSIVVITYTVKCIAELCKQQHGERFAYLVDGCYVTFHAFTSSHGCVVYDVFFDGNFIRTTKPRFHVVLASSFEEAFRQRLARMLCKKSNKKVTFSSFKIVQESIIDINGNIVSGGQPYIVNTDVSSVKRI